MIDNNYLILDVNKENKINKISGPISFYLLKPNSTLYNNNEIILPYILLLGDDHENDKYRCNDDNAIENNKFIEYIDSMAKTLNISFDLYIESPIFKNIKSMMNINKDVNNLDLISNLREKIYYCYFKDLKKDKCIYKNIRFHFSDARFLYNYNEDDNNI